MLAKVDDVYESLTKLPSLYEVNRPKRTGIGPRAYVAETVKIRKDIYITPFAYISDYVEVGDNAVIHLYATVGGGAKVGSNCILYANTTICHDCRIENNCVLHVEYVIGADGFGFAPTPQGYEKILQVGTIIPEGNVEVGADICIDRTIVGTIVVHSGAKLDDLIQVAHNNKIGSHTVMATQMDIADSTKVGEWCMSNGQVGIAGYLKIGSQVNLGAQSNVPGNIKSGSQLTGTPPMELERYLKTSIAQGSLPEVQIELRNLRKEVEELKQRLNR